MNKSRARLGFSFSFAFFLLLAACSPESEKADLPQLPAIDLSTRDEVQSQAISAALSAAKASPQSSDAAGRLAQLLEAAGFAKEAERCYARAEALNPESVRWIYLRSLLQLQDEPSIAISNLARAVQLTPATNEAPRLRLAQALIERGLYAEASNHLRRILAVIPHHPGARVELARILLSSNRPDGIEELLRPSLTNAFTVRPALLLLSQARQRLGDAEGAEALARRAAAMPRPFDWPDPYLREVQSLRSDRQYLPERAHSLLIHGKLDEANAVLEQLLERSPNNAEALLLLGRLRIQQRRCSDAETILQRHLVLQTNSLQGFVQLGLARFCNGQWMDAAASFRRAIEIKPDFAQAHYNLGIALSRAGNATGAIEAYLNALRSNPADSNAEAALAEEYLRASDLVRARRHAEAALRLDPKNARSRKVLDSTMEQK